MIDLEFSKYDDPRDTLYGPYRCTCAPKQPCPGCKAQQRGHPCAAPASRRATIGARVGATAPNGKAIRSLEVRRAELRALLAQWLAATGQFPLPSEMQAHSQTRPRPDWARTPTLVYYVYESFQAWYADGLAHGIGSLVIREQTADRLARLRTTVRRRPRREEA